MPSIVSPLAQDAIAALEALPRLESPAASASAADLDAVRRWPGWGPLAPALEGTPDESWTPVADRLDSLLPPEDIGAGFKVCDTAFYTPPLVMTAIYDLLREAGFRAGRVLEPGCGSGKFMTAAPDDMDITWTGVEIDPTSARIARALNPSADIITAPLQKVPFRSGEFDAAVGNIPFSKSYVFDPAYTSGSLHEYFLLRALDAVRPGGYVVVVTSRFSMDAPNGLNQVLDIADLRAAIRLPSGTFKAEGTTVVADILALQRRPSGQPRSGWDDKAENHETYETRDYYGGRVEGSRRREFKVTTPISGTSGPVDPVGVNRYWEVRPEHVAGEMRVTRHQRNPLAVVSSDIPGEIARAVKEATLHIAPMTPKDGAAPDPHADVVLEDADGRKEGSFHFAEDGTTLCKVLDGKMEPLARATAELKALVNLRDAALALVAAEADLGRPDPAIEPSRARARDLYTAYVKRWGPLNRGTLHEGAIDDETGYPKMSWRRPAMGGFRRDPDYVTVLALEDYDPDTGDSSPAAILLRRINKPPEVIEYVDTPGEALSVTLGERGTLDLTRVAALLGLPSEQEAVAALGDLVYQNPATEAWESARDYLSGNVREKLRTAEAAVAAGRTAYARNVASLREVVPEDLTEHDIRVSLGAPWLTVQDISDFIHQEFGCRVLVKHMSVIASWEIDGGYSRVSEEARLTYATPKMDPLALTEHGLNGKVPVVWDEVWDPDKRKHRKVRNQPETLAATEKLTAINDRFSSWVWEDSDRSERIKRDYNERFNSHVTRRHNGAHLTFPGLAAGVELWPWQRDIVDRIVSSPRTLCGHAVGAGKTLSMVAAAMTLRRFGLARKPLIIVPNHLLEQIAREAKQAFPVGKFLIAAKEDLSKDNRRLFAARCATGDWDAVVMTHQAFTSLPVDPEAEARWIEDQKFNLQIHLQQYGSDHGRGAKQVARMLRNYEARIEALRHNTADTDAVRFDHLGIDFLAVDECHLFKRLPVATRAEGFNMGSSKRATDLLLKIETLAQRNPDRPCVAFFSGTPWSNTLAETYVWQTYLQPDRLREAGVEHFDAWSAAFVRYETRVEVAPDGSGFRLYRRPSTIQNVDELFSGMLGEVADILPGDALPLKRPDRVVENVAVDATPAQRAFVRDLAARAETIRGGRSKDTRHPNDNMLLVCTDGRKVALDPRLVGIEETSPKVEEAAQRIATLYEQTKDTRYGDENTTGAFQLVFSDLGTPKPGNGQTYGRLRSRLIERGVPAEKVRWAHEATTDKARAALFAACRNGEVAVLLASTDKAGLGTNVQTRLAAVHHVDAPWRPSDLEQRDGRGIRTGNLNASVYILRYVAVGTFDGFMWQTLERKARFIAQIFRREGPVREIEDLGDVSLSYGEVKALAAGNPLLMEQATIAAEVRRLRMLRSLHRRGVADANRRASEYGQHEATLRARAERLRYMAAGAAPEDAQDGTDLADFAAVVRAGRGFLGGTWRGLRLRAEDGGRERRQYVTVTMGPDERGSLPAAEFNVSRKTLRRSSEKIADYLATELTHVLDTAQDEAARLDKMADQDAADAAEALAAVSGAIFKEEAALQDAERRLASITADIEDQAAA